MTDDLFKTGAGIDALGKIQGEKNDPLVGQTLGDDTVLSLIAEGGMSRVYLAERQVGAAIRQVALKISPQSGLDESIAERFALEQGVLANLNHPNIAQLYDAGATEQGWPYFVMEYVDGGPIDRYCASKALDARARVRLLLPIVDAVAFAHAKLIVHRDIKPSNVMVTTNGTPKLLDFGIAKLLEGSDPGLTRDVPMTPRYASPEQLLNMPISTGTDIYQLGLLLYELLTGDSLNRETSLAEAVEKASQGDDVALDPAAAQKLPHELRRIIEHCLRTRTTDRYRDASALKADLEAWLEGYPVKAVGLSRAYRFSKFARRHWLSLAATAAFMVVITAALVQTNLQAKRIEAARANLERVTTFQQDILLAIDPEAMGSRLGDQIRRSVTEGVDGEALARAEENFARVAEAVNFTDLARAAIDESILDNALSSIDTEFADQPDVANDLRMAVSAVYFHIGLFGKAVPLNEAAVEYLRVSVGDRDPKTLSALNDLGTLSFYTGEYARAESLYREAHEGRMTTLGPNHPDTLKGQNDLGNVLVDLNRLDESQAMLSAALAGHRVVSGADDPLTTSTMSNLGYVHFVLGEYDEAVPLWEEALQINQRKLPPAHPETLNAMNNLAALYARVDRVVDAEQLHRDALASKTQVFGETHPSTIESINNLAANLQRQSRFEESAELFGLAAERSAQALGETHPNAIKMAGNYASALIDLGKLEEGLARTNAALELAATSLPPDHDITGVLYSRKGRVLRLMKDFEASEAAFFEGRRILIDTIGISGARRKSYLSLMLDLYRDWGKDEAAAAIEAEMADGG